MISIDSLTSLKGLKIYFIGIKGTGMAALAELFLNSGAIISGSDVNEKFYTDEILTALKINYYESFDEAHISDDTNLVIYSAAYNPETNVELKKVISMGLEKLTYAEALGMISKIYKSCAVSGVHGKTSTSAICGTLVKHCNVDASVLTGSVASNFNNRSTLINGDKYFIAECCEYKRHFLNFTPEKIILTSVEADHLDYFKDYNDIKSAFIEFILKMPKGGELFYCYDDDGARETALNIQEQRSDLKLTPYGKTAVGDYKITNIVTGDGELSFNLQAYPNTSFTLKVPGEHTVLNSAAAIALLSSIAKDEGSLDDTFIKNLQEGINQFNGTKRRSELIGEAKGIIFMDDYAHHPTAIKTTLKGIKDFHKNKRIIVDFMSHTYSRTKALLDDFAQSFDSADYVILHKIYASAREKNTYNINGKDLYLKVCQNHNNVKYFDEVMDAKDFVKDLLRPGDIFISMGAGNNWQLSYNIYDLLKE